MQIPNSKIQEGIAVLATMNEVWPEQASERVRPVYEDVRTSFHVPDIPFPFRFLAHWPSYLAFAVRQFTPYLRSLAAEAASDALRQRAVDLLAVPVAKRETLLGAHLLILREQQVLPKVVLTLTAFAVGLQGRRSDSAPILGLHLEKDEPLPVRPAEIPRQIDERLLPLPDFRTLPAGTTAILQNLADLRGLPTVDDYSRALAVAHPTVLHQIVNWRRELGPDLVAQAHVALANLVDQLIRRFTLPGRIVLADFMVPSETLHTILAVVSVLRDIAIHALLEVTLSRLAIEGVDAARQAPFPLTISVE